MFLAHMPAGYLLTRAIERRGYRARGLMAVGLVASILPDFDLLYFYLVDARRTAHHYYFTHFPAFWLLVAALVLAVLALLRRKDLMVYVWVGLANILLHLVLDTVAAEILWLYPFSDTTFYLTYVPDLYDPWWMNFVWHWTGLIEIAIIALAALALVSDWWRQRAGRGNRLPLRPWQGDVPKTGQPSFSLAGRLIGASAFSTKLYPGSTMTVLRAFKPAILPLAALLAATAIAACSMGGMPAGNSSATALSSGLSARMDQPGATLNRAEAIGLINAYRATSGLPALISDTALDGTAQALANQYAQTGTPPQGPQGLTMKLSAGYATFAETFSGWRNSAADAAGLRANATKAGVAVMFNPTSNYGIHWVLVLGN